MYPSSSKHWFIIIMGIINGKAEGDISLLSHAALFISRQQRPLCIAFFLSISDYEIQAGSCMSVKLHALRSGFSTLTVTYQYKEIILKASVTVGAYHPLKVSCNSVPDDNVNCMVTVKRFKSLYSGQFALSTQLIKPNYFVMLLTNAAPQFL